MTLFSRVRNPRQHTLRTKLRAWYSSEYLQWNMAKDKEYPLKGSIFKKKYLVFKKPTENQENKIEIQKCGSFAELTSSEYQWLLTLVSLWGRERERM